MVLSSTGLADGGSGLGGRPPAPVAVKGDTDNTCSGIDLSVHGCLCDDGSDVRMMVLHADEWKVPCPCLLLRPLAGEVSRVGIAGEHGGAHIKELRHAIERCFPRIERLRVFKVADMLGNEALFRVEVAGTGERKGRHFARVRTPRRRMSTKRAERAAQWGAGQILVPAARAGPYR